MVLIFPDIARLIAPVVIRISEVIVRESIRLPSARINGRRASWTIDAEGKEIPEVALNLGLLTEAFLQLLASGIGVVALVWATVVLLGGFSTVLLKIDFWFITAIVLIQTARIVGYNSGPEARFFVDVLIDFSQNSFARVTSITDVVRILSRVPTVITVAPFFAAVALICLSMAGILLIFVGHSYGHSDSSDCKSRKGNIKPALVLFYVLVLIQGALFILWFAVAVHRSFLTKKLSERYFENKIQGRQLIDRYVVGTADTCMQKGVVSTINTTLVSFAAELLQSEVSDDHVRAVPVLHAVIRRKERTAGAVQQIRASEQFVAKLFRILSSEERPFNQEIKAYTAEIVAKLSSSLCLADIPGAANCISSLLDAHSIKTAAYPDSNNHLQSPSENQHIGTRAPNLSSVITPGVIIGSVVANLARILQYILQYISNSNYQQRIVVRNDEHPNTGNRADRKPLIVHGLLILANLAKNRDNATEIYSTKGLFSRITAPISNKLYKVFRDDGTAIEVTEKSLEVLSKLVSAEDETNKKICQEICSSGLALHTIQPILIEDCRYNMLKVPAIKILTKLILTDSSRNDSTILDFIKLLMGLFFENPNDNILRKAAGKALALLSMDSKIYCEIVFNGGTGHSVVRELSTMLHDPSNKLYRTAIAKLLMQFCANLRSEEARQHLAPVKITILHEVLKTICNVEPETDTNQSDLRGINSVQNQSLDSRNQRNDVHNSRNFNPDSGNGDIPPVPIEPGRRKTLVAFLGLAVQMCDKLLDASDLDGAVELRSEAELVDKLKEIIEICNKDSVALLKGKGPSADYLVIIKSVTKFCTWVMRTKPDYVGYFQEKNIAEKLEDALEAMRGLEMTVFLSCSADEIANYETLTSIVEDARRHIDPTATLAP